MSQEFTGTPDGLNQMASGSKQPRNGLTHVLIVIDNKYHR